MIRKYGLGSSFSGLLRSCDIYSNDKKLSIIINTIVHVHVPVVASIGYLRLGNTLIESDTTFLAPVDVAMIDEIIQTLS